MRGRGAVIKFVVFAKACRGPRSRSSVRARRERRAVLLASGVANRKPTERIVRRHDFGLPWVPPVAGGRLACDGGPLFRELAPNQGMAGRHDLSRLRLRWWLWHTSCVIGSTALVGEHWSFSGNHFDVWGTCNEVEGAVQKPILAISRERNVALHCADAGVMRLLQGCKVKSGAGRQSWVACKAATPNQSAKAPR